MVLDGLERKSECMNKDQIKTLRNNGPDNGNAYPSTGKMCWRLVGRQWKNDKRNANENGEGSFL